MTNLFKLLDEELKKCAVWKAAVGENDELVKLLRSNEDLPASVRSELALLISGKLVPAKRKRGRPVAEEIPSIAIARHVFNNLGRAVLTYDSEAKAARESGKLHKKSQQLIERVAIEYNIQTDVLRNAISNRHRLPKIPDIESDDAAPFRRWLAERGKWKLTTQNK